jgi:hypothetical protein
MVGVINGAAAAAAAVVVVVFGGERSRPLSAGRSDGTATTASFPVRGMLAYSQLMPRARHLLHYGQRWSQRRLPRAHARHTLRSVSGL